MDPLIATFFFGVLAALAMAAFLLAIEKSGWAKSDDYWIFEKLMFPKSTRARLLGLSIHVLMGGFFSFLYVFLWSTFDLKPIVYPVIGLATGFMHGVGVAYSQIILFSDAENGFKVGFTHAASHAVFGIILGISVGLADENFGYVDKYAATIRIESSVKF